MARIGTSENPMVDQDSVTVAAAMAKDLFETPSRKQGVWWFQGNFWVWQAGKWVKRDWESMKMEVCRWLTGRWAMVNGVATTVEKVTVSKHVCEEVLFAMKSAKEAWWTKAPVWTERKGPEGMDADYCVGFQDVVVCVRGGEERVVERDEGWFDTAVLPVRYERGAKCERWEEAVKQWGNGDERWGQLLKRWMGYMLVPHREYRKMMLMEGVTAGGKGVICEVVKALLGTGFFSTECETLAGEFSLGGIQHAKVCSITEMSRLDTAGGQKVSRVIKNLVGGDPITINEKFQAQVRDVVCRAAVMMSSNQIPSLPNESQGLSAKMLVLPFTVSFDQKGAEYGLKGRLVREELEGIAAWAMKGLLELEGDGQGEKWPEPEEARDVVLKFKVMNNPMAAFLESRFIQKSGGWVAAKLVRAEWERFLKDNGVVCKVPMNQLLVRLEQEGGWTIKRGKRRDDQRKMPLMGIHGVALKMNVEEWL